MGETTGIKWTDHTFNPWWGCTKVSPGCDHCYAETFDRRVGGAHWGKGADRRVFAQKHWNEPLKWNAAAEKAGRRARVFCASMADVFDAEAPAGQLERLWALIRETPHLDWQLLTKRPSRIARALPADWEGGYPNVWLGTTVENQEQAEIRIPVLLQVPAVVRFLSCEPLIGPVNLDRPRCDTHDRDFVGTCDELGEYCTECAADGWSGEMSFGHWLGDIEDGIGWVIAGGESGPGARPCSLDWLRSLRDQCTSSGVAFFCKQIGPHAYESRPAEGAPQGVEHALENLASREPHPQRRWFTDWTLVHQGGDSMWFRYWRPTDRKGGDWDEWPVELRVRQFPEVRHA